MASRIGVVESEDRTFRSSEGAWLSAECATAVSANWEVDTFDFKGGLDVEGCVVLEGSMTGLGEMVGTREPSVVV